MADTTQPDRRTALAAALGGAALLSASAAQAAQPKKRGRTGLSAEDRLDVLDLMSRYAWYLDTADAEKWADLFAPGAKAIFGNAYLDTREKLIGYFETLPIMMEMPGRQHHVHTTMIDGAADGASCTVHSYMMATSLSPAGNLHAFLASGYYKDVCVRIDGVWYFKERRFSDWKGEQLNNWAAVQKKHANELTSQWYLQAK